MAYHLTTKPIPTEPLMPTAMSWLMLKMVLERSTLMCEEDALERIFDPPSYHKWTCQALAALSHKESSCRFTEYRNSLSLEM